MTPLRVVLTGGPAGGKTTALDLLARHYRKLGHSVYTAPEIPTLLHNAGVNLIEKMTGGSDDDRECNQEHLLRGALKLQTAMEEVLSALAETDAGNLRPIILLDRGIIDFKGYYKPEIWEWATGQMDCDVDDDYEYYRYDLVLHLTTTAIGAEHHFNNDNPARQCTPELARQLDLQTRNAWQREVLVVDNSTDFQGKLDRMLHHINQALGCWITDRR